MYHIVYKITNLYEDKFYIGMHSTKNLEDGYMGSGKEIRKARQEYGNFFLAKEILYFCKDRETAREIEHSLITEALKNNPEECYNLTTRYGGGNFGGNPRYGEDNHFYGRTHSEESLLKMSEALKERGFGGKRNPFYGKKHKPESIEAANRRREELGTYYIETNPNRLKCQYAKDGLWYCTPEGCFMSSKYAPQVIPISSSTLRKRCKWGDEGVKTVPKTSRNPEEWHGKTWREVGYYTLERKGVPMKTRRNSYTTRRRNTMHTEILAVSERTTLANTLWQDYINFLDTL